MVFITQEALLVRDALLLRGLETPLICHKRGDRLSCQARELCIKQHMFAIMNLLNLDLEHDSLIDTPKRIAKMYVNELFYGLNYANFPKITVFENKMKVNEMIIIRDISVISMCEHHFIIFDGMATVAYIPRERIIGLSKVNRIVDFFSKRPQIQERLTQQIFLALQVLLDTENVAIFVDAVHFCVKARGVRNDSNTVTIALGGIFKSCPNVRQEFFKVTDYCQHI